MQSTEETIAAASVEILQQETQNAREQKVENVDDGQQATKKKKRKNKKKNKTQQSEEQLKDDQKPQNTVDQFQKQQLQQQSKNTQQGAGGEAAAGAQQQQKQPAKKKKKSKKKKQKFSKYLDNSRFRILGDWKQGPYKQTPTASKTIAEQYPDGNFPIGQILEHPSKDQYDNSYRLSSAQMRQKDRIHQIDLQKLRKAAECHRQVRRQAQMQFIKPGRKMIDIVQDIQNLNRKLIQANLTQSGMAFPCGASINHCAAHWTPNPNDTTVLTDKDVVKFDFGTQVNGLIIDCAFTVAFDPVFDNLLNAAKDATNTGIREMGIDARLGEVGQAIQEAMESYELELNGKTLPIKSVRNLNGHSIAPYRIHAGKSVPIVKGGPQTKMEQGELFAIQTFGSTGKGFVMQDTDCSHYMKNFEATKAPIRMPKAGALYSHIQKNFKTLAFARRWLQNGGFPKHVVALRHLVDCGLINDYPPLVDNIGSHVAQFEHTIYLRPSCKEVLSRGDDY